MLCVLELINRHGLIYHGRAGSKTEMKNERGKEERIKDIGAECYKICVVEWEQCTQNELRKVVRETHLRKPYILLSVYSQL